MVILEVKILFCLMNKWVTIKWLEEKVAIVTNVEEKVPFNTKWWTLLCLKNKKKKILSVRSMS